MVKETTYYEDGEKEGTSFYYLKNGALFDSTTYVAGNIHGLHHQFYKGRTSKWEPYKHGKRHGETLSYHDNGTMHRQEFYVEGMRDSTWKEWHENGQIALTSQYTNGLRQGVWTTYSEEGKVIDKDEYKDGWCILVMTRPNTMALVRGRAQGLYRQSTLTTVKKRCIQIPAVNMIQLMTERIGGHMKYRILSRNIRCRRQET